MFKAEIDTPNFSFEAYGASAAEALATLEQGLARHAVQLHNPTPEEWIASVMLDAQVMEIAPGMVFRDRELLRIDDPIATPGPRG